MVFKVENYKIFLGILEFLKLEFPNLEFLGLKYPLTPKI